MEDVGYQIAYNRQELKALIKEYTAKEVIIIALTGYCKLLFFLFLILKFPVVSRSFHAIQHLYTFT